MLMYTFGIKIKVEPYNIRQVQYNAAMKCWGVAEPIVSTSKNSRMAHAFERRKYKELERITRESVA